jgi:hypothetical protein
MKIGDRVYFSGWRFIGDDGVEQVKNIPAILRDIDYLSQSECGPDRYTIEFDDGTEQDTVRECLAACRLGATPEAASRRSQPGEEALRGRGQAGAHRQGSGAAGDTRRPQPGGGEQ